MNETVLTPANVSSSANKLNKQFVMRVDGKIEGSPLYASTPEPATIYDIRTVTA
jgi:hypothetical protein